jgi:hypothetical protein
MAQPKIAERAPRACAACYGQYPTRTHIDYSAAYEGHLIDPENPRGGHVDWLVLCEDCIRSGYELLPEQRNQRDQQADRIKQLEDRVAQAEDYASSLEDVVAKARHREHRETEPKTPAKPRATRKPRYAQ